MERGRLASLRRAFSVLVDRYFEIVSARPVMRDIWSGMQADKQLLGLQIDESAIAALAEIGSRTTLRYVGQLLTPARVLAVTNGKDIISKAEVDEVAAMFIDAKQSSVILTEQADKFIS